MKLGGLLLQAGGPNEGYMHMNLGEPSEIYPSVDLVVFPGLLRLFSLVNALDQFPVSIARCGTHIPAPCKKPIAH